MKSFLILSVWSCVLCLLCGCAVQHGLININIGVMTKKPVVLDAQTPRMLTMESEFTYVTSSEDRGETYLVVPGDSLWKIAGKPQVYDDPFLWPSLWHENRDKIVNPDFIEPGQLLAVRRKFNSDLARLISSQWPKCKRHGK